MKDFVKRMGEDDELRMRVDEVEDVSVSERVSVTGGSCRSPRPQFVVSQSSPSLPAWQQAPELH